MSVGKKALFLVLHPAFILLAIALPSSAQTRIDNPARALAKNAGRIIKLEEVLRIRDDGQTSIFKVPHGFSRGDNGSVYFLDEADGPRLYHYGPEGRLISRFLKKGQGPGEIQHASGFVVAADRIRILAWAPPKIMDLSLDGRYLGESRVGEDCQGLWFLGMAEGKIYGIRDEMFSSSAFRSSSGFTTSTVPNCVYEISPDFRTWKKLYEFPVHMMVRRGSGFRLDPIDAVIQGLSLYILHTAEYRVTELDLRSGGLRHVITRKYDRVKGSSEKSADPDPETKGIEFPDDPFVWDINRILGAAGKLWVFTSVMKPDGNDQEVDLFDGAGRFVDSVILRFPTTGQKHLARWTLLTNDGFFFIPEQEEEGLISIGKYRIRDADLFPALAMPKRMP
jgi:hypothetical protein